MSLATWRDISVIWLSLFCFIGLVIPLGVGYFAIKGMSFVLGKVHPIAQTAQTYSHQIRIVSQSTGERVALPVIEIKRRYTTFESVFRALFFGRKRS